MSWDAYDCQYLIMFVLEWLVMMTSSAGRGGDWEAGEGKEGQTSIAGGPNLHFQEALVSLLSLLQQCHYQSQEPLAYSHQREAICLPWVPLPINYKRPPYQAHVHTHWREAICLPSLPISNSSERNVKESYDNTPFCNSLTHRFWLTIIPDVWKLLVIFSLFYVHASYFRLCIIIVMEMLLKWNVTLWMYM